MAWQARNSAAIEKHLVRMNRRDTTQRCAVSPRSKSNSNESSLKRTPSTEISPVHSNLVVETQEQEQQASGARAREPFMVCLCLLAFHAMVLGVLVPVRIVVEAVQVVMNLVSALGTVIEIANCNTQVESLSKSHLGVGMWLKRMSMICASMSDGFSWLSGLVESLSSNQWHAVATCAVQLVCQVLTKLSIMK